MTRQAQQAQQAQEAYVHPHQQQAPAPRRVRPKKGPDVGQLATELTGWFKQWQRFSAGFNALNLSLASHNNQLPEGERKRGLPVLTTHAASLDGEKVEIVCDLKHVDKAYVPHVLVPLINAQAMGMMDALLNIEFLVTTMKPMLVTITGFDPDQQQEEAPEEEAPEVEPEQEPEA